MKQDFLVRSESNPGAVLNTDNDSLLAYKKKRAKERELEVMKHEVKTLKQDMGEIKFLCQKLLEKLST